MAGESSFGAQFWLDDEAAVLTRIARCLTVPPPGLTATAEDASDHDSEEYAEFVVSPLKRSPEMTITIHRAAGTPAEELLYAAVGTRRGFVVAERDAAGALIAIEGNCVVLGYAPSDLEVEGKKTATITIQPTGAITPPAPWVAPVAP